MELYGVGPGVIRYCTGKTGSKLQKASLRVIRHLKYGWHFGFLFIMDMTKNELEVKIID